jgi:hypothetical protein
MKSVEEVFLWVLRSYDEHELASCHLRWQSVLLARRIASLTVFLTEFVSLARADH